MTMHNANDATSQTSQLTEIAGADLDGISGGANLDFAAIRQRAQPYCPTTVARYGNVNPASVNRPLAQRMANECLAEMGPFQATFARGPIQSALDHAFPK